MKIKDIVLCAILAAILFILQIALAFLPNIEVVSLLIIVYTLLLKHKTLYIIYAFAIMEGLCYGFGLWWWMYLYVWTILYIAVRIFSKNKSVLLWAVVSSLFGLSFGFLCSFPYWLTGGPGAGLAWWISGIPFDILHGAGNFVCTVVLFVPVTRVLRYCMNRLLSS